MSMYDIWNKDIKHHPKPESLWEIKTRELPGIKSHWRPAASKFEVEEAFNMRGNKNILKRIDISLHGAIVFGYPIEINVSGLCPNWESGVFEKYLGGDRYLISGYDCDDCHIRLCN